MEIKMVLHLPRDAASVPVTRQVLDGCLQTLGVAADTRDDIALALSEACANVIQHAGPGEAYEVQVSVRNRRCVIEVVNTTSGDGAVVPDGAGGAADRVGAVALSGDPVPSTAEHGRGLKIIDAVADNLQLTGHERRGTTVHFEKTLEWLPEAPGQHLFNADADAEADADGGRREPGDRQEPLAIPVQEPAMTDSDPAGSAPREEEPSTSQAADDPGYLTQTGEAVGDDGSVVPIIGGLPAVEGSAWDIGAPLDERGAALADDQPGENTSSD